MDFNPADYEITPNSEGSNIRIPGDPRKNISVRQNNPWNLRGQHWGAIGVGSRGFGIYRTPEEGFQAGVKQLQLDQSRGLTFGQFAEKYAPRYENPTWKADVSRMLGGIPDNTPIASIPTEVLGRAVLKRESSTSWPKTGLVDMERRASAVAAKAKSKFNPSDYEIVEESAAAPPSQVNDFVTPVEQRQPQAQTPPWYSQALSATGTALGAPHKYVSKPLAEAIHPRLPGFLQGSEKVPLEKRKEILAELIDFPVYAGAGKLIGMGYGGLKKIFGRGTPAPTGAPAAGGTLADDEAAIMGATRAELGGEAGAGAAPAPFSEIRGPENLPPLGTPSFLNQGLEVGRTSLPGRTVSTPDAAIRYKEGYGNLPPVEYGFARPSKKQIARMQELHPTPEEAARGIQRKLGKGLGKGDATVERVLKYIKDISIQG